MKYQGITPPVRRDHKNHFDAAGKYHISADVPYLRYFVSYVVQFQFYEAMCKAAGKYDPENIGSLPLHNCDFYQSKEAGNLMRSALSLGKSRPWPETMEIFTGNSEMSTKSILNYFEPL